MPNILGQGDGETPLREHVNSPKVRQPQNPSEQDAQGQAEWSSSQDPGAWDL